MTPKTINAHFDGKQIVLDEPFELNQSMKIVVTILSEDDEREDWARLAMQSLERAYGDDEPEYTLDMIKEWNRNYERR
ncbi:MAG TPA: hypothetical protein VF571_05715 [Pyrinomonadaceae bacterium]|jgi:hypothetical protein